MSEPSWTIYRGSAEPTPQAAIERWLKTAPPWREPVDERPPPERRLDADPSWEKRGKTYVVSPSGLEVRRANVALLLRRPLLVTGDPGLGKTTLAYSLAFGLGLGEPLRWEISSRTSLEDGLYHYDAVEHLRSAQSGNTAPVGTFIRLGPLGTALLPTRRPRVLLIDELDKASYDLPNDLLHVFEEASFVIPELQRLGGEERVYPNDARSREDMVVVSHGRIRAHHHPVVVITSNGEREFPEAFLRRCVGLKLPRPDDAHLAEIVRAHFDGKLPADAKLRQALDDYRGKTTDELLQGLFLANQGVPLDDARAGLART